MGIEVKMRFMGEIVTPSHPCFTWNERRGYLTASLKESGARGYRKGYPHVRGSWRSRGDGDLGELLEGLKG
jgi:hypothetical protein